VKGMEGAVCTKQLICQQFLLCCVPATRMTKTIVSIARDQILLETRAALLRKSGQRVISLAGPDEFREYMVQASPVDLLVLGHSLSGSDREQIFGLLQETTHNAPVIELYATASPPKSSAQFLLAVHDQTFESDLLALVRQVLAAAPN